jgi:hypothetical protein
MRFAGLLIGTALLLGAGPADAALTSSEKGQIKDFVAGARAENADKVRALVARTDLTPEESGAVLVESLTPVPFTDQRGIFLKELAFGGASAASRPVLVASVVRGLLARADSIYQRYVGGLDHDARAVQELVAIYAWLDGTIANAGKPTSAAHDSGAGIPPATYAECAKLLGEHVERQGRWLKGDGAIAPTVSRLRAQAQIALVDMLPDGLTRRVDAADRLALKGARRAMLTEWGVLFADAGKLDDTKVERVRQTLARLPAARSDLSLVFVGDGGTIRARGPVTYTRVADERYPFFPASTPSSYDAELSGVLHDLAIVQARRALEERADLRTQAEADAAAATAAPERLLGRPRAPSAEHVVGAAIHALLIDADEARATSVTRLLDKHPETAALLSDALGALAVQAPDVPPAAPATTPGKKIDLGTKSGWTPATVRLAPNGVAIAFVLGKTTWTIDRASPTYTVLGMRRDGQPVRAESARP